MKKSKFDNLNFDSVETLSREELKKITGGYGESNALKLCVIWSPMTSTFDVVYYNSITGGVTAYVTLNVDPANSSYGPC